MPLITSGSGESPRSHSMASQVSDGSQISEMYCTRAEPSSRASMRSSPACSRFFQVMPGGRPKRLRGVAIAPADQRRVDRQAQRAIAGGHGPLDQRARDAAIAITVELKPAAPQGAAAATSSRL